MGIRTLNELRSSFIDYFVKHGHHNAPSGSLVPRSDPTLMFTSAGMVPFKNYFTGLEKSAFSTAVTSQKCVRAGGKHNDLEQVGYTSRHHTFFEMLGNFSFGDYFKDNAIELAWNLITKDFGLPKDRLVVTVYAEDDEAHRLWKKIAGISEDKIIRIATSDNFWSMGNTGPCGPCSEIFFDHGENIAGGPPGSADEDGDRFTEIWNLVFMQYEQIDENTRMDLPKPSIDTGMGLERISAVMQGTHDNYETDLFKALINNIAELTGVSASGEQKVSHRVIADHLRASAFLISDGVLPDREGRGYVLRRIMRRAMRHCHQLGSKEPMMWQLTSELINQMSGAYPELLQSRELIETTLRSEEVRFRRTLERGLKLLEDEVQNIGNDQSLSGQAAFTLYDTYGFPFDLTQDILRGKGIAVDAQGFDKAMATQKAAARKAWSGSGSSEENLSPALIKLSESTEATDFIGYNSTVSEAIVTGLISDGEAVVSVDSHNTDNFILVCNQTPFYGEAGGQVGDKGIALFADGIKGNVTNTTRGIGGIFLHEITIDKTGEQLNGKINVGEAVRLIVDTERRHNLCIHHSATHLLHEGLRRVLGGHVAQKGSLVLPDRLRFDFSHDGNISTSQMNEAVAISNAIVAQNQRVSTRVMGIDEAMASGARALFGEKYGEQVRVVSMGNNNNGVIDASELGSANEYYSTELCGGTHVKQTGDIGLIAVVAQSAVAAGVRRIEAVCGNSLSKWLESREEIISKCADLMNVAAENLPIRLSAKLEENKSLKRELQHSQRSTLLAKAEAAKVLPCDRLVNFMGEIVNGFPPSELKPSVDMIRQKLNDAIVVLINLDETNKASLVVGISEHFTDKIDAGKLARIGAEILGGKGGGGRKDMAQSGGPNGQNAAQVISSLEQEVIRLLK